MVLLLKKSFSKLNNKNMKTINIDQAQIEEIIIRPNESIPVTVSYKLFDDNGDLVTVKKVTIPQNEITKAISDMTTKLLDNIESTEDIK
jgi:hypothetical protein